MTYGAGGSTRATTRPGLPRFRRTALRLHRIFPLVATRKLKSWSSSISYKASGVKHLVALRGDLPSGMGGSAQLVHANQLVAFIRQHTGDHFDINVAAYPEIHPEAESYSKDVYWLGEKFKAGANRAITQYFYTARRLL